LAGAGGIDSPPRKVVVIGLGLTAVDVLLDLSARWPQTEFTAISRHGLLPENHLRVSNAPVDDSAGLIEAMRDTADIRQWSRLLREAMEQEEDWRTVIDSLRPHTPHLWRELPIEQRARFLRHARWAWQRARHRIPPQSAAAIASLEQAGRLQRQRQRMLAVDTVGDRLQLSLVPTQGGVAQTLCADMVIQSTGLNIDVRHSEHRLVSQLLTNAHITADPLNLGVLADDHGRLLHDGKSWPNLFALGSLLRGERWESNAMPEICQQARQLADQVLSG
ncbi:MAG: pyridine nucleotide-disulfide oxidoreductase, partial [Rhodanobacter sp.]|nr:pyridine nucleotide-disulfide oxidoreductase [Rhodanobacter sp.]